MVFVKQLHRYKQQLQDEAAQLQREEHQLREARLVSVRITYFADHAMCTWLLCSGSIRIQSLSCKPST